MPHFCPPLAEVGVLIFGTAIALEFAFNQANPYLSVRINSAVRKEIFMREAPKITVDQLKRRVDAGEDFTLIDVRNPL